MPSTLVLASYGLNEYLNQSILISSNGYIEIVYSYGINRNIQIERYVGFPHTYESQNKYTTFSDYLMSKYYSSEFEFFTPSVPFAVGGNYTATVYTYFKSDEAGRTQVVFITPDDNTDEYYVIKLELYEGEPGFNPAVIDTEMLIKNMVYYEAALS